MNIWPKFYPMCLPQNTSQKPFWNYSSTPWQYHLYNPLGCCVLRQKDLSSERILQTAAHVQVHDDLLQIVLALRLNKPYSLKARAYGDKYIIDIQRKIIYSPGPDLTPFTKDDIELPINPAVLNLD